MGSKIRSLNKFNKVVDKLPVFLYSFIAAMKHVMVLNPYALPFKSIELYLKKQYKTSQKYTGIKH
jgi:hypothetical protein